MHYFVEISSAGVKPWWVLDGVGRDSLLTGRACSFLQRACSFLQRACLPSGSLHPGPSETPDTLTCTSDRGPTATRQSHDRGDCSTDTLGQRVFLGWQIARVRAVGASAEALRTADHFQPQQVPFLDECLVTILSWVSIGCSGAVGSRSPKIASAIGRSEALVLPRIASGHAIRAARAAVVSGVVALA